MFASFKISENMASKYRLFYYDFFGEGEAIRYLLSYGNLPFEDIRLIQDEMAILNPYGEVPVLEIDGKPYFGAVGIWRYLGNEVKLSGNNALENLEIDAVVSSIMDDLKAKTAALMYSQDESLRKTLEEKLLKESIPLFLEKIDKIIEKNDGHLALKRFTWADVFFLGYMESFQATLNDTSILDNYPNISKILNTISSIPSIKAWQDRRPPNRIHHSIKNVRHTSS